MFNGFLNEFKKFAMRGNVIDMAVGIIIGAAFGKIVDSLVKDIIMPPIGLLIGRSQMMEALGGKVIISHMSRRIQRVLELSGIEQYISLDKEEDR